MKLAPVCVAVPIPVPVTVTFPVAVVVPEGAYCTTIVQLAPGLTTWPDTQVPPVAIEKVPPAAPTFATVGAAVNVNGPGLAAPVLLTVMVPVCVVVVPVTKDGAGAEIVRFAPSTVNASVLVVPIGVVTVTVLPPDPAPTAIAQFALTVVAVEVIPVQATLVPEKVTKVAPVRLVPVRVTGTVVPRTPVVGAIEVSVGSSGAVTVNATVLAVAPAGVVTLMFRTPVAAPVGITRLAVTVVSLTTWKVPACTVMVPSPPNPVEPVRPPPVTVTGTVVPLTPEFGAIEVTNGFRTVNVTVPLVPPAVVMLTFLAVPFAVGEIVNVAVTVVALTTVSPLTVTPAPETVIADAPVRLVPVRVTGTTWPWKPELGAIEVSVGGGTVGPWNSTAPISILVPFVSGRGFPKKSVEGARLYVDELVGMWSMAGELEASA